MGQMWSIRISWKGTMVSMDGLGRRTCFRAVLLYDQCSICVITSVKPDSRHQVLLYSLQTIYKMAAIMGVNRCAQALLKYSRKLPYLEPN